MSTMTWEDKAQALQALGPLSVRTRGRGDWYVDCERVELGDGVILAGVHGNGDTPQVAIEDYWERLTTLVEPDGRRWKWVVVNATSPKLRRHYRWNGFMWEPQEIEAAVAAP